MDRNPDVLLTQSTAREKALRQLGGNVRRERTLRNISQGQLAELAGIHSRTVAKIEAGELNIKTDTLTRISRAIGCSASTLTNGTYDTLHRFGTGK